MKVEFLSSPTRSGNTKAFGIVGAIMPGYTITKSFLVVLLKSVLIAAESF